MLYRFLLIVGLLTWLGFGHVDAQAQQRTASVDSAAESSDVPDRIVDRVTASFASGDAEKLLGETSERIEVGLPGTRAYYSRSQAMYVLREFFEDHDPTRFEVEDVSKAGASYFVTGRFWHSRSEQPMHVYTRFATRGSNNLHEIRVEPLR